MPFYAAQSEHPILRKWLSGTTCSCCYCTRGVLFENEEYIVLKHGSHSSYLNRFDGSATCRAYAALYRKADLTPDATGYNRKLYGGDGELKKWEGRISKRKVIEDCRAMGIEFQKPAPAG